MEKWSTFTTETNKDTTLNNHRYTHGEELANTLSHGAGILLGIIAGYFLLIKAAAGNDPHWAVACVSVYLAGMLSSYISSTWYHASAPGTTKELLRKFDHGAIYLHIAGSYSPIILIALREDGGWGWGLFGFVWLCAIIGTVVSFRKMEEHSYVETVCYILMGLSVLVVFKQLFALSPTACYWIIAEGVCYITGAAFYSLRKARYMHSVFHFFVLGGSACHMVAVWDILVKML